MSTTAMNEKFRTATASMIGSADVLRLWGIGIFVVTTCSVICCAWSFPQAPNAAGPFQQRRLRPQPPNNARNNDFYRLHSTKSTPSAGKSVTQQVSTTNIYGPSDQPATTASTSTTTTATTTSSTKTPRFIAVQALLPNKRGGAAFAVDRLESSFSDATGPNSSSTASSSSLSLRDRSFCRLLVTTTERRLGQIDAALETCRHQKRERRSNRPDQQLVKTVLRVGVAQLLFLDVPAHAAVKETVDVLRQQQHTPTGAVVIISEAQIKYVNAVLRRVARERDELLKYSSSTLNAAPWLVEQFRQAWGDAIAEQILAAAMSETPRCLTVNHRIVKELIRQQQEYATQPPSPEQWVANLFPEAEILPQGSIRVVQPPPGPISTWPAYKAGAWWCQDPAATVPALALCQALRRRTDNDTTSSSAAAVASKQPYQVVDLCAAPGGKTAQLCNLLDDSAVVTAVEISPRRSERLAQNRERLQLNWQTIVADACEWWPTTNTVVDGVLLDVPCTATGTASKRPDVLRRDADLTELLQVQQTLAQHAVTNILSVGGILVYATCSLLKQESEDQVTKLLQQHSPGTAAPGAVQLETVPFEHGEIPGFDACIDENGWMRVIPGALPGGLQQCDGFFVARLRRIA